MLKGCAVSSQEALRHFLVAGVIRIVSAGLAIMMLSSLRLIPKSLLSWCWQTPQEGVGVIEPLASLLYSEAKIWTTLPLLPVLRADSLELEVLQTWQYKLIFLVEESHCQKRSHIKREVALCCIECIKHNQIHMTRQMDQMVRKVIDSF